MRRSIAISVLLGIQAGFVVALAGCQFPPAGTPVGTVASSSGAIAANPPQFIIKFKRNTLRCEAADIQRLAQETNVPLALVRPMSGNACVIRQLQEQPYDSARVQKLLQQHPAIELVEADAVMKTM